MASIKLPLNQIAKVSSIKLPLKQTALIIDGFILTEHIIEWKHKAITLIETIKSRLLLESELIDKNHILLKWFGEPVPKVQIFKKLDTEDYPQKPYATVSWSPQEYNMLVDSNSHNFKVIGQNQTGESNDIYIGQDKEYDIKCHIEIPINEKNYFIDIDLISEYRVEVDV